MSAPDQVGTVLVGLGPAGTGVLSAAAADGRLDALLDDGLLALDERARHGGGALGDYHVSSDTTAAVFVETLAPLVAAAPGLAAEPAVRELTGIGGTGPVDVRTAAAALAAGTAPLLDRVRSHPRGEVRFGRRVVAVRPEPGGVAVRTADGATVPARRVVLAVGGRPWVPDALAAAAPAARLVHSDAVLRAPDGALETLLSVRREPVRAVVVGGSHSALAVVRRLLAAGPGRTRIEVAHRSPLRVTYASVADARRAGAAFTDAEVCPLTGRVFRFSGLRWHAAALLEEIRRGEHPDVALRPVPTVAALAAAVGRADLVVAATGYRSAAADLLDGADPGPQVQVVGLATHRREPRDGGEASFDGFVDGVWFYHRSVAPRVLDRLGLPAGPRLAPAGAEAR